MKKVLFILQLFFVFSTIAQPYAGTEKVVIQPTTLKGAQCTPPKTTTFLEINNVRAMVHTAGNLWQVPNQNYSEYEVPKNSGIMALFTAALWLGGTDINGQLKIAALRYRNGQDYWTGPLSKVYAETDAETCFKYDKHFVTTQDMIREFNAWYEAGVNDAQNGTQTQTLLFPNYKIPAIIKEWPAHGDESKGQDFYLAPFFDRDNDGIYDFTKGDYPWHDIKKTKDCKIDRRVSLYGDLNYWWIMNDKGNIHTETGGQPIGMEIRAQAFAFSSNDEINNMTFYNYELINRGTQTLFDTYFGFFTDGALGNPTDDYVGCDVNRGLGYYYNGNNFDANVGGYKGYGNSPPAVGVDFFEGPFQDNDGIDNAYGIGVNQALNGIGFGDQIIDNERFGMRQFLYYSNTTNGANPSQTDPIVNSDYYNYLRGFWKDGTPFYYGGSGHLSDPAANLNVPCDFMFPGDTDPLGWGTNGVPQAPWTEVSSGNVPNDRRFVQSAGPFVLKPGAVNNITVGVVWARANTGVPIESVSVLQRADDKAQALFENCFKVLEGPHAPELSIQELENELILTLTNTVNSNNFREKYKEFDPFIVASNPNADKYYRFQGYQIFQVRDKSVSVSDLANSQKARLVAQCDFKDSVARLINFEFDNDLQASIPIERVKGENKGIQHSFKVSQDQFATGSSKLINFKRYHYMAISYAYNNYKSFIPDDPDALDGQKRVYLSSRKAALGEVKVIEAIPHNPLPESDGTYYSLEYGDSPEITRHDGHGNGGSALRLTEGSIETILENGETDRLTYQKNKGPFQLKVIDPLNLADGYFECKFNQYTPTSTNAVDTASWTIYRYKEAGGELLDSIVSEELINVQNEQLIPQWGISVTIQQVKYNQVLPGNATTSSTSVIGSSISFKDSSLQWLTFVNDNDIFFPTNWIRSGVYTSTPTDCLPLLPPYLNPCNYNDVSGYDNDRIFTKLLNGGIAPHRLTGYEADYMPLCYYKISNPGNARNYASLSFLPSVQIVITADKSKWTRCPVLEMGRSSALNIGTVEPGGLRKSQSVGKDGQPDGTGTGMGWFPGYAIDVESGARLYMAFGENSFLAAENGSDMIWNPTSRMVDQTGTPLMGGVQPFYVFGYRQKTINKFTAGFDFPAYKKNEAEVLSGNFLYQSLLNFDAADASIANTAKRNVYGSLAWIAYPLLKAGQKVNATDVTIQLDVAKEYKNYSATNENSAQPMYSWNMSKNKTITASQQALSDALALINVVPNPYYAFSEYETNKLDNRVKITNLPERCAIRIYSSQGKLVKTMFKDSEATFQDWTLMNEKGIPVASGIYLIQIDVPGIGDRVLKVFLSMRSVDLHGY